MDLFAFSVLVFSDAFIANLMVAGEVFGQNKILSGPMRTVRAEMPGISAQPPSVLRCHESILFGGIGTNKMVVEKVTFKPSVTATTTRRDETRICNGIAGRFARQDRSPAHKDFKKEIQLKSKAEIQVANFFNGATDILLQEFVYLFAEGGVIESKISHISCITQDHCNAYRVKSVTTVVDLLQGTHFAAQRFV